MWFQVKQCRGQLSESAQVLWIAWAHGSRASAKNILLICSYFPGYLWCLMSFSPRQPAPHSVCSSAFFVVLNVCYVLQPSSFRLFWVFSHLLETVPRTPHCGRNLWIFWTTCWLELRAMRSGTLWKDWVVPLVHINLWLACYVRIWLDWLEGNHSPSTEYFGALQSKSAFMSRRDSLTRLDRNRSIGGSWRCQSIRSQHSAKAHSEATGQPSPSQGWFAPGLATTPNGPFFRNLLEAWIVHLRSAGDSHRSWWNLGFKMSLERLNSWLNSWLKSLLSLFHPRRHHGLALYLGADMIFWGLWFFWIWVCLACIHRTWEFLVCLVFDFCRSILHI